MRFVSFASSSKGNAQLISYKNTNILVDCGISKKRIVTSLGSYGLTLDDIDYIFITHEHFDHISGLPMILKEKKIKVISQRETLIKIVEYCKSKGVDVDLNYMCIIKPMNTFDSQNFINAKDIKVYPIKGCHDVPSLFYKFALGDTKVAILTDMGEYNEYVIRSLSDVKLLMLECNYDEEMLQDNEKYSVELKNRIRGKGGHLSNKNTCEIIMQLAKCEIKNVYLSHISDESNSEEYAMKFVTNYLKNNYKEKNPLPEICLAKRIEITEIINN